MPHRDKGLFIKRFCIAIALLCGGGIVVSTPAVGQETPGGWSVPHTLFETSEDVGAVYNPVILADQAGDVHAFWAYTPANSPFQRGQFLFYARLSNGVWSEPVDVLVSPDEKGARVPVAALDNQGYLHLLWQSERTIYGPWTLYYSRAHVAEAGSIRGWREPEVLYQQADPIGYTIWADPYGVLHVVHSSREADRTSSQYLISLDGGNTWSTPREIATTDQPGTYISGGALTQDSGGALHRVLIQSDDPLSESSNVMFYSASLDQGESWREPMALTEPGRIAAPEIVAVGQDQIHVTWLGNFPDSGRYHRWSPDRGQTWRETTNLQRVTGWTGSMPMAVDGEGTVHMVNCAGGGIEKLTYAYWKDGTLSAPEHVQDVVYCHGPQVAISGGNWLNVIWWQKDATRIMFIRRQLSAPAEPVQPVPAALPTSTPAPASTEIVTPKPAESPTATPASSRALDIPDQPGNVTTNPLLPVGVGIMTSLLLIGAVLVWNIFGRGSRSR